MVMTLPTDARSHRMNSVAECGRTRICAHHIDGHAANLTPVPEPQQPSSTPGARQTVSSREVYRTAWIHVREDQVISPRGAPAVYSVVDGVPAVAVVALTADGRVYLVGQHRYPINQYSWELPAGGVDHDEPPLEAARRELREETGLRADTWIALGRHHPANSATSFEMYVFLACDLSEGE